MYEYGDLQVKWVDGRLSITFFKEDGSGELDTEEFEVDHESAYELCKFLMRKFKARLKEDLKKK